LKHNWKILGLVFAAALVFSCNGKTDGKDGSSANTPPVINQISLLPANPTAQSEIKAQITSSDKDGDPITYEIKWFLNGQQIGEGMLFSHEDVEKGDKIFAEIRPYDGKDYGKPVRSSEITIGGLPPRILSVSLTPESVFVTTPQVVLTALAQDPDGDSVSLYAHWVVGDDVIPDTSNVLQLRQYTVKKGDVIHGSAFVTDGESQSEPFIFELHIANAPPVFTTQIDSVKCRPDNVYYKLPIMDPDNDPITFELIEAPSGLSIDQENGAVVGSVGDIEVFDIFVRATDTEGAFLEAQFTLMTPDLSTP
jgi:hypothetical protein